MDLPSTPYFLCLHYFRSAMTHSYFSTSHTTHRFATFLYLGFFRPICFLKAHLFILWAYDPLFLPLGFNDFSIHLLTLFCPCCWASSFYWASKNEHQQTFSLTPHISYSLSYLYIYIVTFIHFNYLILKCSNTLQTYDAEIVYLFNWFKLLKRHMIKDSI